MLRYKGTLALLIKEIIPEYKNRDFKDISLMIYDEQGRSVATPDQSEDDIAIQPYTVEEDDVEKEQQRIKMEMGKEAKLVNMTSGTGSERVVQHDIVILVIDDKSESRYINKVTIDFEMQMSNAHDLKDSHGKSSNYTVEKLGIDPVDKPSDASRPIYYAASLLRDTVPKGDNLYSSIHKVYSVWFFNNNTNITKIRCSKWYR